MARSSQTMRRIHIGRMLIVMGVGLLPMVGAEALNQPKALQIGMVKSFLTDQPKAFAEIASDEFKDVMKTTTGLNGDLVSKYDSFEVAEKLNNKQLDIGIFHAHELAWVRKKYPDLQPMLIAADKDHVERAYLIVNQKCQAKTFADLRGKKLDLPTGTKEHCRAFLAKLCAGSEPKGPAAFFGSIAKSASRFDALDQVARDKAQATVVDLSSLEFYKALKPAVFNNNLRVLEQSDDFPPVAIVVKNGALDPATFKQFRDGLLKAHTNPDGVLLMKSWNIQAFEPVPKAYDKSLTDILKAYPAP